jgi:hypothetical protein
VITGGRLKHPGRHFHRSVIALILNAASTDRTAAFGDRLVHRDEPTEPRMPWVPNFSRLSIVGVAMSTCTIAAVHTRVSGLAFPSIQRGTSIGVGRLSDSRRLFCRRETNSWRAPPRVPSRTEGGLNGAVKCICGRHVLMLRTMQSPPGMIQLWNLCCRRPVTSVYWGKPTP